MNSLISRATLLDKLDRTSDSLNDISCALEIYRANEQKLLGTEDSKNTAHMKSRSCFRISSSGQESPDGYSDEERKTDGYSDEDKKSAVEKEERKTAVEKEDRDTWSHKDAVIEKRGGRGRGELVDRSRKRDGRQSRGVSLLSLLFFRASLYTKLSQPERAVLDLSEAIDIPEENHNNSQQFVRLSLKNDDRFHLFLSRGMCLKSLGQHSEAIKDLSQSLLLSEAYIDTLLSPGMTAGEVEINNENMNRISNININMSKIRDTENIGTESNDNAMGNSNNNNNNNSISAHIAHKSPLLLSLASCLAHRGYCHRKLNQLKCSLEDYSQVIEITPHNVQVCLSDRQPIYL